MTTSRILVPAALACLVMAGCGGTSGEDGDPEAAEDTLPQPQAGSAAPDPQGEEEALEQAVRAYSEAFLGGDAAKAHDLLSSRCRERMPLSEFSRITEQAEQAYGPTPIRSIQVQVNGEQGQATYTFTNGLLDQQREPWVWEQGWRQDDC